MYGKKLIRQEILNLRGSLSSEEVNKKSRMIFNKLMTMEIYCNSKIIMCYMDFKNEVKTEGFIKTSLQKEKRIAVPLIDTDMNGKKGIVPCEIYNMDYELEKGILGILEPKKEFKRVLNPEDIDLVIVPGIAFDLRKNRIGYGAGYYDRFLTSIRRDCLKIGVAFELQIVNEITAEAHDVPLDMIITEKRVIK
ncbi:MAG: 5-formyltetrahydrofolate cyclo-ligase [Firmicutes bacterium]|nr:5-formyltetrahydrofolate cyclo-ligase [Bacillota bacterium]